LTAGHAGGARARDASRTVEISRYFTDEGSGRFRLAARADKPVDSATTINALCLMLIRPLDADLSSLAHRSRMKSIQFSERRI
jgi:hypothetical protein